MVGDGDMTGVVFQKDKEISRNTYVTGCLDWAEGKTYKLEEDNYNNIYHSTIYTSQHIPGTSQLDEYLGKEYMTGMERTYSL